MNNRTYILASDAAKSFTCLNRYDSKGHRFEGEHSLLHNAFSIDGYFLSAFLHSHQEIPLLLLHSQSDRYKEVVGGYGRFLEEDIDKRVEESLEKQKEAQRERESDRSQGQLQLSVLRQLVEEKYRDVKGQSAGKDIDPMVQAGQESALQWMMMTIRNVIDQSNR